jgi:hypothetical protein
MAKLQISPEQLAKVKQTLNVAAPTGGKQTMGSAGKKAGTANANSMPMKKAVGDKSSGNILNQTTVTGKTEPQPKTGRVDLPDVVVIDGQNYSTKDIWRAHDNLVKTYGLMSEEARALRSAAGMVKTEGGGFGIAGRKLAKPDMRGDAKSYVDTVQYVSGFNPRQTERKFEEESRPKDPQNINYTGSGAKIQKFAAETLGMLGIKPSGRNLEQDKNARKTGGSSLNNRYDVDKENFQQY